MYFFLYFHKTYPFPFFAFPVVGEAFFVEIISRTRKTNYGGLKYGKKESKVE